MKLLYQIYTDTSTRVSRLAMRNPQLGTGLAYLEVLRRYEFLPEHIIPVGPSTRTNELRVVRLEKHRKQNVPALWTVGSISLERGCSKE